MSEQLRGESVDVTEWIGMKHSNHLLHAGWRTSPPRRVLAGCAPSGLALHLREHQGCRRCAPRSSAMRTLCPEHEFCEARQFSGACRPSTGLCAGERRSVSEAAVTFWHRKSGASPLG